ncbi:MAG: AAA family ATPase [Actinomycetota bacterium]
MKANEPGPGSNQQSACAQCGRIAGLDDRFCSGCGVALAPPRSGDVRKPLSALFCELITISEGTGAPDPEVEGRLLVRARAELQRVFESHGAIIEPGPPHEVTGIWGLPQAHEDDAMRALRAAAQARAHVSELASTWQQELGAKLRPSFAVVTGETVIPRAGSAPAGTGKALLFARGLMQAAPPEEILLDAETHRLVQNRVEAETLSPGRFRLNRLIEAPRTAPHLGQAPLVNRRRELELLAGVLDRAVADRQWHLFTLIGPAGSGKSRLAKELLAARGSGVEVLRGRCLSYGAGATFHPIGEAVKQMAGIRGDQNAAATVRRLADLTATRHGPGAASVAERVAQLIGLAPGEGPLEEAFWALRQLLAQVADERPVVLVIDDLQWAEPTLLDLLEYLTDGFTAAPVMLLCLARPEFLELRPAWGGGRANTWSASLGPLDQADSELLIESLIGRNSLPGAAQTRILEGAGGNPLFIEETLEMLIDDGLLESEDGRWVASSDLSRLQIPPAIHAVLAARLDHLPGEQRAVLECASVVGKVFHRDAVAALLPPGFRDLDAILQDLLRKGLIATGTLNIDPPGTFRFIQSLLRDATYAGIVRTERAQLHEGHAAWLEKSLTEESRESDEAIAYHLQQAYRYRREESPETELRELADRAGRWLAAAGRKAFDAWDMAGAAALLDRALDFFSAEDPARLKLLPDLAYACKQLGEVDRAEMLLEEGLARAERLGEEKAGLHSGLLLLELELESRGLQTDLAEKQLSDLAARAERAGDDLAISRAWYVRSFVHWIQLHEEEHARCLERSLGYARRAGSRHDEVRILGELAPSPWGPTPVSRGIQSCHQVLEQTAGSTRVRATTLCRLAGFEALRGDFDSARPHLQEAWAIFEELGLTSLIARMACEYGGFIEFLAGRFDEAVAYFRQGCDSLRQQGQMGYMATLAAELARALFAQGKHAEAERFLSETRAAAAPDDVDALQLAQSTEARLLAARGEFEEAERVAREAFDSIKKSDFVLLHANALLNLAQVLAAAGRGEEAQQAAEDAARHYELKESAYLAAQARELARSITVG